MLAHKKTTANFVGLLVVAFLVMLSAGRSSAQTSLSSADNQKVGADSAQVSPAIKSASEPKSAPNAVAAETATLNSKLAPSTGAAPAPPPPQCKRTITADVVAMAQPIMLNRLGAAIPGGKIFVLKSDTVDGKGNQLLPGKRPRPIVLRANIGDCLTITLTNNIPKEKFVNPPPPPGPTPTPSPNSPEPFNTSEVSLHIEGMEWVTGTQDDGSFVGQNASSLASAASSPSPMPPQTQSYTLYAKAEGTYLMYTMGDTTSTADQLTNGLFGALNVEPSGVYPSGPSAGKVWQAEWYRSQVTADDMLLATYNANRPEQVPAGSLVCNPPGPDGNSNCTFTINGKSVQVIKTPDFGSGPGLSKGGYLHTLDTHPLIKYDAVYPAKRLDGSALPPDLVGKPILQMLDANNKIVHTDLTAVITGPNAGRFPGANGNPNVQDPPCNSNSAMPGAGIDPLFCQNPALPDRKQPYREITIMYHGALGDGLDGTQGAAVQAFPFLSNKGQFFSTVVAGQDSFAINYGTGGIAAEIYANRIGVGPMAACVDCKFEEFFLSAWSVGDPAMLVDVPANASAKAPLPPSPPTPPTAPPPPLCTAAQLGDPGTPPDLNCANPRQPASGTPFVVIPKTKATRAYYPDDPSNVYNSYINDHVKFRILHGGRDVTHVHHQHAHQWLQSPNSDEASYLDSQMISPGASYTLEMVYNGSGNRNKVVGDSIFHCHFYPHFAAGMWAMWRTHDTFESGTFVYPDGTTVNSVDVSGQPVPGSRALPDGEIIAGAPAPAIVPMPTLPMAPLPAYAQIQNNVPVAGSPAPIKQGGQVVVGGTCKANQINGLDVIGGCTDGTLLSGTVINSQYDFARIKMFGQFSKLTSSNSGNPGYPYFIPGIAGARAPHPPLDFACAQKDANGNCLPTAYLDGGLPRHLVYGGSIKVESHDSKDWSKDLATMSAVQLPENGTTIEQAAMAYFGKRCYATSLPDGTPGICPSSVSSPPQMTFNTPPTPTGFILNGLPRKNLTPGINNAEKLGAQPGAPFADPGVDDNGNSIGTVRRYQAAAIQLNVTFNKSRWHFPQQRMLTLWKDVKPTLAYKFGNPASGRQPEPLFFRGNSGDIIEYWHTNLVPNYYLVDDFQVRTPTDILGQHIHLVKFDVTSSDGAGNGFNYEDGTFSPEEVQDIHAALTAPGGLWTSCTGCSATLRGPTPPPADICSVPNPPTQCASEWKGAQTTIQRWYIDPLVDNAGVDRTMRTVFTHDHFGPSTHQQAGLYAGLLIEPIGSTWTSNDCLPNSSGTTCAPTTFGSRSDGGPTSWQAIIQTGANNSDSYREFMLEFQDLQLAYQFKKLPAVNTTPSSDPKKGYSDPDNAVNPPLGGPSLITTGIPATPAGTQSVNYANELIATRLAPPGMFTDPRVSDLSYPFDNSIQTIFNPADKPDPLTPLMRAYQGDKIQLRILVGAHVFPHQFNFEGPTWFAEPAWANSGYRSQQAMGLSEHFEFLFTVPSSSAPNIARPCPDGLSTKNCVDYLYSPSMDQGGIVNGMWGLFRSYDPTKLATDLINSARKLPALPNNAVGPTAKVTYATCKPGAPQKTFNITAVTAQVAIPPPGIVFNDRVPSDATAPSPTPTCDLKCQLIGKYGLYNDLGIMYVRSEDLNSSGQLKPGVPVEPLVIRANAGDCITVNLTNAIATTSAVLKTQFSVPQLTRTLSPSRYVGLHPQLLSYDPFSSSGVNVGWNTKNNPDQVVSFSSDGSKKITYQWYAGKIDRATNGTLNYTPVEFGSLNLFPSDPLFQHANGLFGQMIIEPLGAKPPQCDARDSSGNLIKASAQAVPCDPSATFDPATVKGYTRTSATVTLADNTTTFREASVMVSDTMRVVGINGNYNGGTSTGAVNYRVEPWTYRYQRNLTGDFSCMLSNQLQQAPLNPSNAATPMGDPKTPIFTAEPGDSFRFRLTHPFGTGNSQVFVLNGHVWQRNPYTNLSTVIGNNRLSQWIGSRDNHGSTDHFDLVIDKAGGEGGLAGDYLYSVFQFRQVSTGTWGIFRVGHATPSSNPNAQCKPKTAPGYYPQPKPDVLDRFERTGIPEKKP